MKWIVVWGVSAFAAAALAAVFAGQKNRDYSYWMAWCFLFPAIGRLADVDAEKRRTATAPTAP